ncbi:MAG: hypothetical protein HRU16_00105, partial [Planctomycetes bacterium]|nr:hypothetical protein [Planctomycetota bacterium]
MASQSNVSCYRWNLILYLLITTGFLCSSSSLFAQGSGQVFYVDQDVNGVAG